MPITLYYLSGSPFAWKVWLALEHKQLAYDMRILSADAGELKTPEFMAMNQRGKVPAIVDDGFVLYESGAIVEYLEDKYPQSGQSLWPSHANTRALARRIASEADGYIYPWVRRLVQELIMRREGQPDNIVIEEAKTTLLREFALLKPAFSRPFISGEYPCTADFALYPLTAILGRIQSKQPSYKVAEVVPEAVHQWMRRVEALPYFSKTIPPHWKSQ
jgi:glutathione S-transferase